MKKIIITTGIYLLSLSCFSQTDSVELKKQQKIIQDIVSKTPISELQNFLYENLITAKQYNEFMRYYNAFIEKKYFEEKAKAITNK